VVNKREVLAQLESWADPEAVAGMARYGIQGLRAYGVRIPRTRRLARELGRDQRLALELWGVPTRETRILACMVAEPERTSAGQAEAWARQFTDWEVCDQCCMNLFEKAPWAWEKALEWSRDEAEFVKRAGFVLMARLAVSAKEAPDERFYPFLERVAAAAGDPRPMVKKALSWALRQIGKRGSRALTARSLALAEKLAESPDRHARWVGKDALRDLKPRA
jgi:3-methyladenine DNA glycosylase AlkD